eukprot:6172128-Pleurochrysis_carterae.AAC.1
MGRNYDPDRMSALPATLQRETVREHGVSSAPAATSIAILPASAQLTTVVGSSASITAAASVATNTLIHAAASVAVASYQRFHATSPGDSRTSRPSEPTRVPPPPPRVLEELRRALHAVREE